MRKTVGMVKLETVVWINSQLSLGVISPLQAIKLIQACKEATDLSDMESIGEDIHRLIKLQSKNKNEKAN